jgi:hypothetical protein
MIYSDKFVSRSHLDVLMRQVVDSKRPCIENALNTLVDSA